MLSMLFVFCITKLHDILHSIVYVNMMCAVLLLTWHFTINVIMHILWDRKSLKLFTPKLQVALFSTVAVFLQYQWQLGFVYSDM